MLVDRTCLRCNAAFQTEPRHIRRGRGLFCGRACATGHARDERWKHHHQDLSWVWNSVDRSGGPDAGWPFNGRRGKRGYGRATVNGRDVQVTRIAYESHFGVAPGSFLVCHRCDNPPCCNPAHLFLGTDLDNARDAAAKGRKKGQPRRFDHQEAASLIEQGQSYERVAARLGVHHISVRRAVAALRARLAMVEAQS